MVGRNDLCPCGSGKKYKKCCASKPQKDAKNALHRAFEEKNYRLVIQLAAKEFSKPDCDETTILFAIKSIIKLGGYDDALELFKAKRHQIKRCDSLKALSDFFFDEGLTLHEEIALKELIDKNCYFKSLYYRYSFLLAEQMKYNEAVVFLEKELHKNPKNSGAHVLMGTICGKRFRWGDAVNAFRKAQTFDRTLETDLLLLTALTNNKDYKDAEKLLIRLRASKVIYKGFDAIEALIHFGEKRYAECINASEKLLFDNGSRSIPLVEAYFGSLCVYESALDAAQKLVDKGLEFNNPSVTAYGIDFKVKSRTLRSALAERERAVSKWPCSKDIQLSTLLSLLYFDEAEKVIKEKHQAVAHLFKRNKIKLQNRSSTTINLAFVSSDFRQHSVAYFLKPVLENLNRDIFKIFCYFNYKKEDEMTESFLALSDGWRNFNDKTPPSALSYFAREDKIDIAFDLNGFTTGGALNFFANGLAPIQISWIGYPATTGLDIIDYKVVDNITDPKPEADEWYSEKLIRLPNVFSVYQPHQQMPPVQQKPPFLKNQFVTFGSFNNASKITDEMIDTWAVLLNAVAGSKLFLKSIFYKYAEVKEKIIDQFKEKGVSENRIIFSAFSPTQLDHFLEYNKVDIALDTFPYCGTTTTCEALYMGVPVISLYGKSHRSRVGLSQLTALGLKELAVDSKQAYVDVAQNLAEDFNKLKTLRASLREKMIASPLMDAQTFTRNFERELQSLMASTN